MSTAVTYREAMRELGVSRSTVERRLRLTRIPTQLVDGRTVFDLETLVDAWAGHRAAIEAEKAEKEKATETSITVSIPGWMRQEIDQLVARDDVSMASVVRSAIAYGLPSV